MEQLNEDKGQDEYYEGNSKKRNRQNCPLSYKILIFITVASSLLSLYLIYSSFSKKKLYKLFANSRIPLFSKEI